METDKKEYAARLANRAEKAVGIIKIIVIAVVAFAVGLVIYAFVALYAIEDKSAAFIGLIVFMALFCALFVGFAAALIYAKVNLNKLKKL